MKLSLNCLSLSQLRALAPHITACSLICIVTVLWVIFSGKDLSWDVINHHAYLPFSLFSGRYLNDLFAAGPQSYQNPAGYIPFFLLLKSGLPDWGVGIVLAVVHASGVFAVYGIALRLWKGVAGCWWVALACFAGALSPIYLQFVGTSSSDPLNAALVLWALFFLISRQTPGTSALVVSGALLGAATGIKFSSAIFAFACAGIVLHSVLLRLVSLGAAVTFVVSGIVGFLICYGFWGWQLWLHFANPFFPFFNNVFHSPFAASEMLVHQRFLPETYFDYVRRIFDMATFRRYVYTEGFAPDLRPAALILVAVFGVVGIVAGITSRSKESYRKWSLIDVRLAIFSVLSYSLWMLASGNGRYALALLTVVGILFVRVAYLVLREDFALLCVSVVLLLQGAYFVSAADQRWVPVPWSGATYFNVVVPDRLRSEPFFHLTFGTQSHAFLALYLDPRGAMANPVGQMSLPMDGPLGMQLRGRLEKWKGRTRILVNAFSLNEPKQRENAERILGAVLYRFGLSPVLDDCERISIITPKVAGTQFVRADRVRQVNEESLMSCLVRNSEGKDSVIEAERQIVDEVFSVIERRCPKIFSPANGVTERGSRIWLRFYAASDAIVSVSQEEGVWLHQSRSNVDDEIGSVEDVRSGKMKYDCSRRPPQTPL